MRPESHYLTSRFGKRTFGLLIALVIIPVTAAVSFALVNLEHELLQQAEQQLRRSAKEYGLSVLQRLILIKREAMSSRSDIGTDQLYEPPFRYIAGDTEKIVLRAQERSSLPGSPVEAALPGLITEGTPGSPRIYMVHRYQNSPVVVEIDPDYLWGPSDHLPLPHVCVTGTDRHPLYCSSSTSVALLGESIADHGKTSEQSPIKRAIYDVHMDEQEYLGYAWDLFLSADFASPDWSVYVFQTKEETFSPAESFKRLFVPVVIALIAGTLLFGVIQIRRRLRPLDELVTGTREIANRNFDTRIEVESGDEFEDLALAFNSMTRRLGKQISTLKTLSKIDKTILKTLDIEVVSADISRSLNELASPVCTAIVLTDGDSRDQGHVYYTLGGSETITKTPVKMEFGDIHWNQHRNGLYMTEQHADLPFLAPLHDSGAHSYFAIPFFSDDQLDGVLCIGTQESGDPNSETREIVEDFSDRLAVAIAADKKEKLLQKQANYDSLTGLPNRFLFKDRLERSIIHAQGKKHSVAVLFLDLDRFKTVNDTLGHSHGDKLLKEAASRLISCVGKGDTVARLGGDEFVVLVSETDSVSKVVSMANKIMDAFTEPVYLKNRELMIGASIGIALFPQDGKDSEELLRNADTAMYAAKSHGRGVYLFFDHAMNRRLKERAQIETDLWHAVKAWDFEIWYQPQLDITDGTVRGAEALLRWRHAKRGIVAPDQFVPLAEELGLIERIGSRCLEMACKQYFDWRAQGLVLDRIALNVSPREFIQENYVSRVYDTLNRFEMPPLRLTLEITENLLIHDTEKVMTRLFLLKDAGVSFSIDDFGIGYSSLAYLQKLPIDTIKIDGSFIQDVTSNNESAAIVSAILDMAARLNISVIAEGVETTEQLNYLREHGCAQIQGYLYSKALRPDEFLSFSKARMI